LPDVFIERHWRRPSTPGRLGLRLRKDRSDINAADGDIYRRGGLGRRERVSQVRGCGALTVIVSHRGANCARNQSAHCRRFNRVAMFARFYFRR
jgi:hypothetical protein